MQFSAYEAATSWSINQFMYRVYAWMSAAMVTSGLIAYVVGTNPTLVGKLIQNPLILLIIVIAQFALVIVLSSQALKLDYAATVVLFLGYAMLTGLTLSVLFLIYTNASLYQTFFITAGAFALTSLYGYYTQTDLTKLGNFMVMGLFGLIIAMVVNIFWHNTTFDLVISVVGVLLFTVLTAFDVQRIKAIGQQVLADRHTLQKVAIQGALVLYLDFLNLFLFLLRFTGRQRQ